MQQKGLGRLACLLSGFFKIFHIYNSKMTSNSLYEKNLDTFASFCDKYVICPCPVYTNTMSMFLGDLCVFVYIMCTRHG